MSIQTGREGEKIVSLLCTQAGVTCNSALEDDNGWDLHLEFPADRLPRTPIDLQPAPHRALVQVKATRGANKTCRIKLSNALRFAKSPLPCFIVLVQLRGSAARRIYITHIWTDHIARFLKEGRKADAQRNTAIHKIRMPIEFSSKDDQTEDPIGWIRDQIASHDKSYGAAKQQIVETVGFENGYGTAKVTFNLASPDDIVDWQLGLKESLSVSRFIFTPERFGIAAGKPQFDAEAGRMYLTPNGRPAKLRLSLPSGEHLTIPAELFVSAVPGLSGSTALAHSRRLS